MRIVISTLTAAALVSLAVFGACTVETESEATSDKTALPCNVAEIVEAHCLVCHGVPLRSGAPMPLTTLGTWRAQSFADLSQSYGQRSVVRMKDVANSMPPAGALAPADVAVIDDWVAAGMPGGDCEPATPGDPLLDAMPTCSSMDFWPAPSHEAPGRSEEEMFPGMPCNDCHRDPLKYGQPEYGPDFELGGTVFPSAHEPDNCAGLDGAAVTDVVVHIEDANGSTWDLRPNGAGNFWLEDSGLVPPFSARVISANGVRAMSLRPTSGDCNLCHTENGSSGADPNGPVAPGRIVVPSPPL